VAFSICGDQWNFARDPGMPESTIKYCIESSLGLTQLF
jgi:hypothetical protein